MSRTLQCLWLTRITFLVWVGLNVFCHSTAAVEINFSVCAEPQHLVVKWQVPPPSTDARASTDKIEIREHPAHTRPNSSAPSSTVLWRGDAASGQVSVPRFEGLRDRLFSRFELIAGLPPHSVRWVTDFNDGERRSHSLGSIESKKGITCVLDPSDARDLGCRQVNQNILINSLLDLANPDPSLSFEYEGHRIGLQPRAVAALDRELQTAHRDHQRVTGILLNLVGKGTPSDSPLVHPLTPRESVPIGPSAFNVATAEGTFFFRAIVHWLVERYTRPDAPYGHLAGLVIGNEIQSHWSWYHLGLADSETVLSEYARALRLADLAARNVHTSFQVYVSLEHHWAMSAAEHPLKGFSGKYALERLNRIIKAEGDFPWALAFHPYPENLFNPAFWNDRTAPLRMDAPRITFHNLEVLPVFLRQPELLFRGTVRTIALTEQVFHCPQNPEGEALQAAAFALAWKKVSAMPEIESFLYHRHVDHPHEHGLHCGIREHDGSPNIHGLGRKRKIHEVIQAAGTAREDAAFAFALPLLARTGWSRVIESAIRPAKAPPQPAERLVLDLLHSPIAPEPHNLQAVEKRKMGTADEVPLQAVQLHPNPKGKGRWLFKSVSLPKEAATACGLHFELLLDHAQSRGAAFFVEINGGEIFSQKLSPMERCAHRLDLGPWSGQSIDIALGVEALEDPAHDWCLWIQPRIVIPCR